MIAPVQSNTTELPSFFPYSYLPFSYTENPDFQHQYTHSSVQSITSYSTVPELHQCHY